MKFRIQSPYWLAGSALSLALLGLWSARTSPAREAAPPQPVAVRPQPVEAPLSALANPAPPPALDSWQISERLVDAIIAVESQGDPRCVGRAGERGLMQIKRETWREMTRELFGRALSFQQAFDPAINRRVGRAYLARLHAMLSEHQGRWKADERALLIAAYNAGPTCVALRSFNLRRMHSSTRDYVERVTALHDHFLAGQATALRPLLADAAKTRNPMLAQL